MIVKFSIWIGIPIATICLGVAIAIRDTTAIIVSVVAVCLGLLTLELDRRGY